MKGSYSTKNWPLILGISLLLLGIGPLASYLLAARLGYGDDPNPNPVHLGMLAGLTFYPSLGLIVWGFFRRRKDRKARGKQ